VPRKLVKALVQAKHEGGCQRTLLPFPATRHDAQVLVQVVQESRQEQHLASHCLLVQLHQVGIDLVLAG
jgi:hypothetical protein